MEDKLTKIKEWLDTGSINIFGLPMSGKDTQGVRLAEGLGAKFLSSGIIIRSLEKQIGVSYTGDGSLAPTNVFYECVLPYFERKELFGFPFILSSIGRWSGEEDQVMSVAAGSGHEIKAVLYLELTEDTARQRFEAAKALKDRGDRTDDGSIEIFNNRLNEFRSKTIPVLEHYDDLGLLIRVDGDQSRDEVFAEIVEKLYERIS